MRSAVSRFTGRWRTDFADPVSLAGLRARILLATGVGSLASTVITGATDHQAWTTQRAAAFAYALVFESAVVLVSWLLGARLGDAAFALIVYTGYPVIGTTLAASDATAAIPMVALCSLLPTTVAVLFLQRPLIAYVGVALGVLTVAAVAAARPSGDRTTIEFVTCVLCLTVIGVTMRLVRDLAVSALTRSRQVEATDTLTGLQNRRGLERSGTAVRQRAARAGVPLSALVLDLDHFKRINDEQGHAAGDEVLRRIGALLTERTRAEDVVARLGGEEFLVLSTCVPDTVDVFAERLRRTIETELTPVTVSIGVHTEPAAEDAEWPAALWTMVNRADRALYRAKAAGRNRVAMTGDDAEETAAGATAAAPVVPGQRDAVPSRSAAAGRGGEAG